MRTYVLAWRTADEYIGILKLDQHSKKAPASRLTGGGGGEVSERRSERQRQILQGRKRAQTLSESEASPNLRGRDTLQQVSPGLVVRKRGRSFSGEEEEEGSKRSRKLIGC